MAMNDAADDVIAAAVWHLVLGRPGDEPTLLRVASIYEAATSIGARRRISGPWRAGRSGDRQSGRFTKPEARNAASAARFFVPPSNVKHLLIRRNRRVDLLQRDDTLRQRLARGAPVFQRCRAGDSSSAFLRGRHTARPFRDVCASIVTTCRLSCRVARSARPRSAFPGVSSAHRRPALNSCPRGRGVHPVHRRSSRERPGYLARRGAGAAKPDLSRPGSTPQDRPCAELVCRVRRRLLRDLPRVAGFDQDVASAASILDHRLAESALCRARTLSRSACRGSSIDAAFAYALASAPWERESPDHACLCSTIATILS